MDLILWRHAEAEDLHEGGPQEGSDLHRSLTSRGEKQAARMAAWLDRQLPEGARIVVFLGDNGYFFGEHGLGPERRFAYEEGIKSPFLIRYPAWFKPGAVAGAGAMASEQVAGSGDRPSTHARSDRGAIARIEGKRVPCQERRGVVASQP